MIQHRIDIKQKEVKPHKEAKGSGRQSNVLEALRCGLNLITD